MRRRNEEEDAPSLKRVRVSYSHHFYETHQQRGHFLSHAEIRSRVWFPSSRREWKKKSEQSDWVSVWRRSCKPLHTHRSADRCDRSSFRFQTKEGDRRRALTRLLILYWSLISHQESFLDRCRGKLLLKFRAVRWNPTRRLQVCADRAHLVTCDHGCQVHMKQSVLLKRLVVCDSGAKCFHWTSADVVKMDAR